MAVIIILITVIVGNFTGKCKVKTPVGQIQIQIPNNKTDKFKIKNTKPRKHNTSAYIQLKR